MIEDQEYHWHNTRTNNRLYQGEEINIQAYRGEQMFIYNHFAEKHFSYYNKTNHLIFCDGPNIMTNRGSNFTCGWSQKRYPLRYVGDSINYDDGSIAIMLEEKDLRELLEETFFLPHQPRFYNFLNDELLLLKW
ncbi:hypothetical protein VUJ46_13825 [Chryseobacterium sp. MYb264]|uniref:hypothetical protein n=1 Tax=Chryseobacterium sp. MYb264 TaxID=2745153 RepID=UPI002E13DC9C|nr:hypothetical protein VUJ46_13825 [Chryseobacterium sp. MYb264]